MRFVCLDFETNGFYDESVPVLPWTSYPIQISLTAVENGTVVHLYDSLIKGAVFSHLGAGECPDHAV